MGNEFMSQTQYEQLLHHITELVRHEAATRSEIFKLGAEVSQLRCEVKEIYGEVAEIRGEVRALQEKTDEQYNALRQEMQEFRTEMNEKITSLGEEMRIGWQECSYRDHELAMRVNYLEKQMAKS